VRPGASRTSVGGHQAGGEGAPAGAADQFPPLLVCVQARAVDGAATAASERALARALGIRPKQVSVVRGFTSRDKLVEIADPDPQLAQRWRALLGLAGPGGEPA
jgi:hypothetical protein